jgi:hypothetical protein
VGIAIPGVYLDWSAGYFHRKDEFVEFNMVSCSSDRSRPQKKNALTENAASFSNSN